MESKQKRKKSELFLFLPTKISNYIRNIRYMQKRERKKIDRIDSNEI